MGESMGLAVGTETDSYNFMTDGSSDGNLRARL